MLTIILGILAIPTILQLIGILIFVAINIIGLIADKVQKLGGKR